MKRPFEAVLEIFRNNLSQAVDIDKSNHEFLHQFTTWLLSFSVGALYLIASNFTNLKSYLSYWTIKSIIIALTISIITGILHRIFLYLYQGIYNTNVFYAESALSNNMMMAVNPVDVSHENNIENLVELLKRDYGVDDSAIIGLYNNANDSRKEEILAFLRRKYQGTGDWAKKDYEIAFGHVNEVMKKTFGLTDKEISRASDMSSEKMRIFRYVFSYLLYVSCISFLAALLILAIAY